MAGGYNKVMLIGNLGSEPQIRSTPSGTQVASFSLAINEYRRNQQTNELVESTEWVRCVAFGRNAETVSRYLHKGSQVHIEGKLRTTTYEKDGQKHYSTEVVLENYNGLLMLGGRPQNQDAQNQYTYDNSSDSNYGGNRNSYNNGYSANSYGQGNSSNVYGQSNFGNSYGNAGSANNYGQNNYGNSYGRNNTSNSYNQVNSGNTPYGNQQNGNSNSNYAQGNNLNYIQKTDQKPYEMASKKQNEALNDFGPDFTRTSQSPKAESASPVASETPREPPIDMDDSLPF